MIKEFEIEVLKFIVRSIEGGTLIKEVPESFFNDPVYALILMALKKYYEKFRHMPMRANLFQFLMDSELEKETVDQLTPSFRDIFETEFKIEKEHLKYKVIQEVQKHRTKQLFAEFMDKLDTDDSIFESIYKQMRNVLSVSDQLFGSTDAKFVLQDFSGFTHIEYEDIIQTPFKGMDEYMSAKGIFSPQLIVIMAPMKGFKTGMMVNFAVSGLLQGKNIFYADFENGEVDIINRMYCRMTKASYEEMQEDVTEDLLKEVVKFHGARGGDIYVKSYEMFKGTPAQVRADIERLAASGWKTDMIIWDYPDIATPSASDDRRQDKRLKIQSVYGEIKNINKEFKASSIVPSQVNREALDKPIASAKDISEDIGKIANSDGIWALLQTMEEEKKGVGRLQIVVQRKGSPFTGSEFVYLRLEKDKMLAEEISQQEWMNAVDVEIDEDDLEDI